MKKQQIFLVIFITVLFTTIANYAVNKVFFDDGMKHDSQQELIMDFDIPKTSKAVTNLWYITVKGKKTPLSGKQLQVGDVLTGAILDKRANYFDEVETTSIDKISGYKIIETVPSLDTPVCTMQTKQLEFSAKKYPDINFVVVSHDTPFALQRFCSVNKIDNLQVLSDARTREFGTKNSLFMSEYGLLARTIMIVDENNKIQYIEYADEVTKELDLMNALAKLNELLAAKNK